MRKEKRSRGATPARVQPQASHVIRYTLSQRLLHWAHTLAFLGLMGTGLLLLPYEWQPFNIRERIGGYSRMLLHWHNWLAIAFIAIPTLLLLASLVAGRRKASEERGSRRGPRGSSRSSARALWLNRAKRGHLAWTLLMASAFIVTGVIMWAGWSYFPPMLVEWAFYIHDWLTYVSIPLMLGHFVILHLLGAREAMQGMVLGKVRKEWADSVAPPGKG